MHGLKKTVRLKFIHFKQTFSSKNTSANSSGALLRENILNKFKTKLNNPTTYRWLFYRIKYFHHLKKRVKQKGSSQWLALNQSVVLSKEPWGGDPVGSFLAKANAVLYIALILAGPTWESPGEAAHILHVHRGGVVAWGRRQGKLGPTVVSGNQWLPS